MHNFQDGFEGNYIEDNTSSKFVTNNDFNNKKLRRATTSITKTSIIITTASNTYTNSKQPSLQT